jgi:hypothetical protein
MRVARIFAIVTLVFLGRSGIVGAIPVIHPPGRAHLADAEEIAAVATELLGDTSAFAASLSQPRNRLACPHAGRVGASKFLREFA